MAIKDEWQRWAKCRGQGWETWFPSKQGRDAPFVVTEEARKICGGCPVRKACLDFAIDNNIDFGVWGGESVNARQRIRRERKRVLPRL